MHNKTFGIKLNTWLFLITGFLFLGICSVNLFSDGMFMDGLLYADISRNMAEGIGSFWKPHLTAGLYPEFYEHPPLALGLQSLAFSVFGDSILVERFYSFSTFIITGSLIVLIWGKLTSDKSSGWLPLLLWIITKDVSWSAANNMLENSMSIFVCMSFLFYMNSNKNKKLLWLLLSGVSLSLALLSKGFFCLYIWSVPFFFWSIGKKIKFKRMFTDSMFLFSFTLLPIVALYYLSPGAQNNMISYFNKQVIGSIENVQTVASRFAILRMFLENIAAPLILGIVIVIWNRFKSKYPQTSNSERKVSLAFLGIVLSGVIPIMISLKQSGFYILTVYPFFALALANYLYPILKPKIESLSSNLRFYRMMKITGLTVMLISLSLSIFSIGKTGRDATLINDSKTIIGIVGEGSTIGLSSDLFSNWSLHGYCSRYGKVSLDANPIRLNNYDYYLGLKNSELKQPNHNFELMNLNLGKFNLYQKTENIN